MLPGCLSQQQVSGMVHNDFTLHGCFYLHQIIWGMRLNVKAFTPQHTVPTHLGHRQAFLVQRLRLRGLQPSTPMTWAYCKRTSSQPCNNKVPLLFVYRFNQRLECNRHCHTQLQKYVSLLVSYSTVLLRYKCFFN